jgi:Fe-S cluster assembly protein SufD
MDVEQQRKHMQAIFEQMPLPKEREEAWRHTSIERLPLGQFLSFSEPSFSFSASKDAQEKGVVFCDLRTALRRHPELIEKHYLATASVQDKLMALAASQWQNGVFLFVPKNVQLDIPLAATIRCAGNTALYNIMIVEKGSSMSYLEEYEFLSEKESLSAAITEIFAEENAKVGFHYLCKAADAHRHFGSLSAKVEQNATMNWFWGAFGGKLNRVKMDTILAGAGSTTENNGVFIGKNKEHLDATTNVHHKAENTTNNMEVKGIMKDSSSAIYRGLIKIFKEGRGTNSYLSNHVLKLSERAIANSIPALEIDNNEVKASHGATVGQIDEEQLFYLRSRGLSQEEAEHLIVNGFLMPLVEKISVDEFKEKFAHALETA